MAYTSDFVLVFCGDSHSGNFRQFWERGIPGIPLVRDGN